jgi:transcriptional regulator with XRE-family HTH domain
MRNLPDEILKAPRGTQRLIIERTGLSKMTVWRVLHKGTVTISTAYAIAAAFGKKSRWRELLADPAKDAE